MPNSADFDATDARMNPTQRREVLLADICDLTAMPFPNLLYRVLAEEPAQLEVCWQRVRSGLLLVGAHRVREQLATRVCGAGVPAGPLDHLDGERRRTLTDILDVYDSGNSCNAVLVSLMLHGSTGELVSGPFLGPSPGVSAARRPLPPMLELDDMAKPVRRQMLQLAQLGDPEGDVVPSLFRHLGQDEELLSAVATMLRAASTSGEFDQVHGQILTAIENAAAHWPEPVAPIVDPGIRSVIEPFARTIPRMLTVSAVLRSTGSERA